MQFPTLWSKLNQANTEQKRRTERFFPRNGVENEIFHTGAFYFGSLLNTQHTWKGKWCYNCDYNVFFLHIISKLADMQYIQHANVSSFSEYLCNNTLEIMKTFLAQKFTHFSQIIFLLQIIIKKKLGRVYLFFVTSLSCHCGSLKIYIKSLLKKIYSH